MCVVRSLTDGGTARAAGDAGLLHDDGTHGASRVPPKAALRTVPAPPRDGRPGTWSDLLDRQHSDDSSSQGQERGDSDEPGVAQRMGQGSSEKGYQESGL